MNMKRIFGYMGAMTIGLLTQMLLGTVPGIIGAVIGYYLGSNFLKWPNKNETNDKSN